MKEEKQPKPLTLKEQVANAQIIAQQVENIRKVAASQIPKKDLEWFAINDIVKHSKMGHEQVKEWLFTIGMYGLLKEGARDNKRKFKIVFDQKEREGIIQTTIDSTKEELRVVKSNLQFLKELKKTKISPI